MKAAKEVATDFMQALWRGDVAEVDRLSTPDAVWVFQPGMPYAAEGGRTWPLRDALRRIIDDLFSAFPEDTGFDVEVTSLIAEGDEVAIEYEARGTPRSGTPYHNVYAARLTVSDGRIASLRPYNDTRHMLESLG